jgi:hypothetical protein
MTFTEIEQLVRREIDDEVGADADKYVRQWQILSYLNDAEREACIRGRLLTDSTTADICRINLTAGVATYLFDPRILLVLRGKLAGALKPLSKISFTRMDELVDGWEDQAGEVVAFVTGMDKNVLRLFRVPTVSGVLNLTTVRLPLQDITKTSSPEIAPYLHASLVPWIKYRIYSNQDSELVNKARANEMLAQFEAKFGKRPADQGDIFEAMQIPQYELGIDLCAHDYV